MEPSRRVLRFWAYRLLRALGLCRPVALVVEEHEEIAVFLGRRLRAAGFSVYHAFDGMTGVQKALALEPDLLVLDGFMPELDGLQVLRILRATRAGRRAKIILESGYPRWKDLALDAGADAFFAKPFQVGELVETARWLMGQAP